MKHLFFYVAILMVICPPVQADEKVDAAVRTLDALEADAGKLQGYCAILKEILAIGDDETKGEELSIKMEEYLSTLGPEYEAAWELGGSLAEGTVDAAKLEEAFEALEDKCLE